MHQSLQAQKLTITGSFTQRLMKTLILFRETITSFFFFLVLCKEKLTCIMHQNKSSLPIALHRRKVFPSSCCSSLDQVRDTLWTSTALLNPVELTGLSSKLTCHQGRLKTANSCDYPPPNWWNKPNFSTSTNSSITSARETSAIFWADGTTLTELSPKSVPSL